MSRTITAMFDTRADAEAAKNRLEAASLDVSHVDITDKAAAGYGDNTLVGSGTTAPESQGFWASLKNAFSHGDDRHVYEEGIRRGGTLLTATVHADDADKAVDILDNANSVDIDGRANDWKAGGWAGGPLTTGTSQPTRTSQPTATSQPMVSGGTTGAGTATAGMGRNEEMIPVVEETLRVGKREVERGGVRVRSYVVETPVSEQVSLHDEHVSVDRRPVTGGTVPADAFRERTIEMTETAEEAVVAKDARVVEEVVVRKTADDRTETVNDTVRRTEVEVDNLGDTGTSRSGTAGQGVGGMASVGNGGAGGTGLGDKIAGLAKEGAGKITGNEDLERRGEAQQGKTGY
ncbi:MAG: DUF2382 domain-containing protein [Janthinobacterium lividum]